VFYKLIWYGYVKGQMTNSIVGRPCSTVPEIIPAYAPSSDGNTINGYIAAVEHTVTVWRSGHCFNYLNLSQVASAASGSPPSL